MPRSFYVPDCSSKGLELVRSIFGAAWFQTRWAFEESKHRLVFREYLTRSGLRSETEVEAEDSTQAMIELELSENRPATIADLAEVLSGFKMPEDGLIPNYREGFGLPERL